MPRRRRKHKPLDVWRQRALSYKGVLNQSLAQQERDNIVATLSIHVLRRLLAPQPLEPGDIEKVAHLAHNTLAEIDRLKAVIERNALATMLQRMRFAIINDGREAYRGPRSKEYEAAVNYYRDMMVGPWKKAFSGPLGDDTPLGMERVLG